MAAGEAARRSDRISSARALLQDKLLDAQSMRDMFAKETDMYRSELKAQCPRLSRSRGLLFAARPAAGASDT